tara:strand:+ start:282 stop:1016 length:735 start_codon:yes stop_codon:yes gene_type:complete
MSSEIAVIILAAGKGKRMDSDIPKVLHKLNGTTLIERVIKTSRKLHCKKIITVIGHQKELVKQSLIEYKDVTFAIQNEQKGTAHAVKMCFENLENFDGNVLILSGDVPLISSKTLEKLIKAKENTGAKASVLTADIDDPIGYGRIIRNSSESLNQIKEHKDCNQEQLLINEINAGIYVIESESLFEYIPKIGNQNAQGEYYLPDLINLLVLDNFSVELHKTEQIIEISGVNSQEQLRELELYSK